MTYEETNDIKTSNNNIVPTWLYTNLSGESTATKPYGYWLLTTYPPESPSARILYYDERIPIPFSSEISYDTAPTVKDYGVRPVITLTK